MHFSNLALSIVSSKDDLATFVFGAFVPVALTIAAME